MTNQHPITPPPELVQQWHDDWLKAKIKHVNFDEYVATRAARWGADQELEACCAHIHTIHGKDRADWLRFMRRPKPPSLKEQALEALYQIESESPTGSFGETIRRALEALPDD